MPKEIYSLIRSRILSFKLLPGERISDKEIAEELGTSRTPAREALIHLTNHGLVTSMHNKGFSVRKFTIKEVEDIYILREALEVLAVKLSIQHDDRKKIKRIQTLIESYPKLMDSENRNEFNKADEDFHILIADCCDNQPLKDQLNSLHDQLAVLRRYAHMLSNFPREAYESATYAEHSAILNHMLNKNVDEAIQAMSAHIQASKESVIEALKRNL